MAYTPNPAWQDGEGGTLISADSLNNIEDGITDAHNAVSGLGLGIPPGRYFQLTRSDNASFKFGNVQGTEYGVGISLADMTISALKVHVSIAGDTGTIFRVGLRRLTGPHYSAPVIDADFVVDKSGPLTHTLSAPVTIPAGPYALSWVRIGDTANKTTLQRSSYSNNIHLFPISSNAGWVATGHGPVHGILNTGITGALPSTVTLGNVGTNQEGTSVPQIEALLA